MDTSFILGRGRMAVLARLPQHLDFQQLTNLSWELRNNGAAGVVAPCDGAEASGLPQIDFSNPLWLKGPSATRLVLEESTGFKAPSESVITVDFIGFSNWQHLSSFALTNEIALVVDFEGVNLPLNQLQAQILALFSLGVAGIILNVDPQGPLDGEAFGEILSRVKDLSSVLGRELVRIPQSPPQFTGVSPQAEQYLSPISFQGEHGAYSEMAVYSLFSKETHRALPKKNFRDVFESVLLGECLFGVVPVENALAGSVYDNYDLLLEYEDIHIVGETKVRIEHNLIGLPGVGLDQIQRVFSHPQGLAQSSAFLDRYPHWERVPFYDTAGSVAHIAQEGHPEWAAIASSEAARVYGMEILKAGVETNHKNFTRFFVLSRTSQPTQGRPDKASLVFSTSHSPGALSQCLTILAAHRLNMRRLESRPIHGKPWEYMFYVDVEVPENDSDFQQAILEIRRVSEDFRVLGVYRTGSPWTRP